MEIRRGVSLAGYSNYRIGGPASFFAEAENKDDVREAIRFAGDNGLRIFILGGGTNILFPDEGFPGLVLKIENRGIEVEGNHLIVASGEPLMNAVMKSLEAGLSGLEWATGIPGTVGGAVRGNAGAFGGEMKDSVSFVKTIDIKTGEEKTRDGAGSEFGYRDSIFKRRGDEIILETDFRLSYDGAVEARHRAGEYLEKRRAKHPTTKPNAGSVFRNVDARNLTDDEKKIYIIKNDPFPIIPAGYLIENAGLKGVRIGGAEVSPAHANFLVNENNATAKDIRDLIVLVKEKVKEKYGFDLEEEIQIVR